MRIPIGDPGCTPVKIRAAALNLPWLRQRCKTMARCLPIYRAAVFCYDEKTQCQALDRTQPSLPMKPDRGQTMTHDCKRHGTIDCSPR